MPWTQRLTNTFAAVVFITIVFTPRSAFPEEQVLIEESEVRGIGSVTVVFNTPVDSKVNHNPTLSLCVRLKDDRVVNVYQHMFQHNCVAIKGIPVVVEASPRELLFAFCVCDTLISDKVLFSIYVRRCKVDTPVLEQIPAVIVVGSAPEPCTIHDRIPYADILQGSVSPNKYEKIMAYAPTIVSASVKENVESVSVRFGAEVFTFEWDNVDSSWGVPAFPE